MSGPANLADDRHACAAACCGADARPERLFTPRERGCLSRVADGLSRIEIGAKLNIATSTAHIHVENAKRKLEARTRAQAVARAFVLGELLVS